MRLLLALLGAAVIAVYATAIASAQAASFGFEDGALDAMPPTANAYGDLVAGRMELDGTTLRATLDVSLLPEMQPGIAYGFIFSDGRQDHYAAIVGVPMPIYIYGEWDGDSPESVEEGAGSYSTGPSGKIVLEMPLSAVGNATALSKPRGLVIDIKSDFLPLPVGGVVLVLDTAEGQGELALPARANGTAAAGAATEDEPPATAPEDEATTPAAAREEPAARVPLGGPLVAIATLACAALFARSR